MTLRVRYAGTDLFPEGVVEVVHEANGFKVADDNTLLLRAKFTEDGEVKVRTVGTIHRDKWAGVVAVDDELADCE
jgi:hypothetical protein